jgi:hypothetical protein
MTADLCPCATREGAPPRARNHKGLCWWRRERLAGKAPRVAPMLPAGGYTAAQQLEDALALLLEIVELGRRAVERAKREGVLR